MRATQGTGKSRLPDAEAGMDPECEEVLAICRAVFETPLGLDDGFAEAGGHSILIARLAQKLQAAGWVVPVRALLSDCNTARKVASRPRALQQASKASAAPVKSGENSAERDEAAAEVLSIGYFTTLQVLFAIFLYSPLLVAFLSVFDFIEFGTFFTTASLWAFIIDGFFLYLLALVMPFASLLWVMTIKFFMGGDIYKNNVTPGVYPKWSKMHLRIWCIGRLETMVLLPLRAMYRSAPLMAFALRQLGATVGDNLQCAHDADLSGPLDLISIEDDVAISDRGLHPNDQVVGAAPARRPCSSRERLQDRDASRHRQQCDGGPRHLDHSVHPHPQPTWARRRCGKELPRASAAAARS